MQRSINAVLAGTFTLRFSTGLTAGLLAYYLADLEGYGGGAGATAIQVAILTATFYLAELLLSPIFGVLSDRVGAHRVMQLGPLFGAVAVVMTALTTDLFLLGVTRWLEGAAAAASIPSILGFIAAATSLDEGLRGRVVARFEAATLAGLGIGIVAAGGAWELLERTAFFVNAALYMGSFAIFRYGVLAARGRVAGMSDEPGVGDAAAVHRYGIDRYLALLRSRSVWLLAPTWIAVNAFIGAWTSQSIFQLVNEPNPNFADQQLMGGYGPMGVSIALAVALLVFFAGLFYWGNRFKRYRRTTIMGIGIVGGLAMVGAIWGLNHASGLVLTVPLILVAAAGLFVLAGATPAALGMLADISEEHPEDRGAVMGLYSVFLALGQISGSLLGGGAAEWQGINGLLLASGGMLLVAMLPLRWLRGSEHLLGPSVATTDPAPVRVRADDRS